MTFFPKYRNYITIWGWYIIWKFQVVQFFFSLRRFWTIASLRFPYIKKCNNFCTVSVLFFFHSSGLIAVLGHWSIKNSVLHFWAFIYIYILSASEAFNEVFLAFQVHWACESWGNVSFQSYALGSRGNWRGQALLGSSQLLEYKK